MKLSRTRCHVLVSSDGFNGLFQLNERTSCLFTTSIWQVIDRVHVVYVPWFSWTPTSSLCLGIGGPRFFPRVATTMTSKGFMKVSWIMGGWNRKYLEKRLRTSLLVRSAVLYQTLLGQTQEKPYFSKFPKGLI